MSEFSENAILEVVRQFHLAGQAEVTSTEVASRAQVSHATARRYLDTLSKDGKLIRSGQTRGTRYRLATMPDTSSMAAGAHAPSHEQPIGTNSTQNANGPVWTKAALALKEKLSVPLTQRAPVTYQRSFVDAYVPNETFLMPPELAGALSRAAGLKDRLPAGTYARKVLEQLQLDLSWSSSRLEGNRYSLLETKDLFEGVRTATDTDSIMLLNHKSAIEFLAEAVPEEGLTRSVISNIHSLLMNDLLVDENGLGTVRKKVVNITGTVYLPTQAPVLLNDMFHSIVEKARAIRDPIESAFFLWVNLAYLQPFEDGNKRTSRLSANIPLLIYNCAPLAFMDVALDDYAQAMLGVYEFQDLSIAVDVFAWTYRRSIDKYRVVVESMAAPNRLRLAYRQNLQEAIGLIIGHQKSLSAAMAELGLDEASAPGFREMLHNELKNLGEHNYARYRVTRTMFLRWVDANRPQ